MPKLKFVIDTNLQSGLVYGIDPGKKPTSLEIGYGDKVFRITIDVFADGIGTIYTDKDKYNFEVKGLTSDGWVRFGKDFYLNGEKVDPDNYRVLKDGIKPFSFCVGSDLYDSLYAKNGRGYIPGGVNLTRPEYSFNDISYGQGNDVISYVEGLDGRNYTAQLTNLTYDKYDVWNAERNCPVLFYQDKGTDTWCQYIKPIDPIELDGTDLMKGVGRIWSGSFYQFGEDTTLAGFDFKLGEVFYLFVSPQHSNKPEREMFGVKLDTNEEVIFWGVAKDFNSRIYTGGIIERGATHKGDPRMFIEDNLLYYVSNGNHGYDVCAYGLVQVETLIPRGVAKCIVGALRTVKDMGAPSKGRFNNECPAPFKLKDVNGITQNYFAWSNQIVDVGGVWNTFVNNNWVQQCDAAWGKLEEPWLLDIGYDSYAIAASSSRDLKKVHWTTSGFNWGGNALKNTKYAYTSGSYPFKIFTANSSGRLKIDVAGFSKIPFNGSDVSIMRDEVVAAKIKFENGKCYLDGKNAVQGEFVWTNEGNAANVWNDPVNVPVDAIQEIWYKVLNKYIFVIIKTNANFHDTTCSCFFLKDGEYKIK